MNDIQNGINTGETVTVHDTQITLNGWSGTGYTILDPELGAGAYMIGGELDGGFLLETSIGGLTASALIYSAVPAVATVLRMVILLLALVSTMVFLVSLIFITLLLATGILTFQLSIKNMQVKRYNMLNYFLAIFWLTLFAYTHILAKKDITGIRHKPYQKLIGFFIAINMFAILFELDFLEFSTIVSTSLMILDIFLIYFFKSRHQ